MSMCDCGFDRVSRMLYAGIGNIEEKKKIMPRSSRKSSMRNPMGSMSTKAKVIAIIVAVVVIMVGTIIGYRKIGGNLQSEEG